MLRSQFIDFTRRDVNALSGQTFQPVQSQVLKSDLNLALRSGYARHS